MSLLTLEPPDPELDLYTYIGQRSATFKFELVNGTTGAVTKQLYPYRDSTPSLSHDTSRTIMRQVSNVFFDNLDTADINVIRDRVRISMLLPERDPYVLGTFVFADQARLRVTSGVESNAGLLDQMFIVDQQIEQSIGFLATGGIAVPLAIDTVMAGIPVSYTIDPMPAGYKTIGSWTAGTSRGQVLNDLAVDGNFLAPWFNNDDVMRFIQSFDIAIAIPSFNFDVGNRVSRSEIIETDDLIYAPNRFVLISNSAGSDDLAAAPIVGRYDVPASAPHSIANRGFVVPAVIDRQMASPAQAQIIAKNIGQQQTIFERIELETPPDPRHDSYQVFRWQGENWLEIAWSMDLIEGGTMRHVGRKAYS